jgi:hypothetical protein
MSDIASDHPSDYFTTRELKNRGWTRELIAAVLGSPDVSGNQGNQNRAPITTPNRWSRVRVKEALAARPDVAADIAQRANEWRDAPLPRTLRDRIEDSTAATGAIAADNKAGLAMRQRVVDIYAGSNAADTRRLYRDLECCGSNGAIAAALLRVQKSSDRAKVYRGGVRGLGSFRSLSYQRKGDSMDALCTLLAESGMQWGWGIDDAQPMHRHVLYVDLPTGQTSFHAAERGAGPDYPGRWDGQPGMTAGRIIDWAALLLVP